MNGKDIIEIPERISNGDPRVCMLLGDQKFPSVGECICKSRFSYILYEEGRYLLFNTLTRELLVLPPRLIDYFTDGRMFPASILSEEIPAKLYKRYFLVPEHTQESQLYMELKELLVVKEELPHGITHYVILPTTTCNARCFYCFEQGMQYRKMSRETVENTLRFILQHKPKNQNRIHIHWFGGEPMCAADHIDRICAGLTEAGVEYTAEMTSNGSLFTEELAHKAAQIWNIAKIQITLDGMAEEYALRKRYTNAIQDPFETVICNIHLLIAAGISVAVRLNVDENNLGEIYRVVDFLGKEFSAAEKKKMAVYAHSLFGQSGDGAVDCPLVAGSDELEIRVQEINDYILRHELVPFDPGPLFTLKTHYCMVTAPECNVLIDAEGRLFACDAMPENMRYGDVKSGIDAERWKRVAAPCNIRAECEHCVFLPRCTEFDRCPTRMEHDYCYRHEKRSLDRELRYVYALYREQMRKEAESVSD